VVDADGTLTMTAGRRALAGHFGYVAWLLDDSGVGCR